MTQKELNYVEDFYNHLSLFNKILLNTMETIEDDEVNRMLNSQLTECEKTTKKIQKMLGDEC